MNGLISAISGADGATLSALLMLIASALNSENGAVNVNLASSSLPITDFVTGQGTPDNTKTQPPGNGATRPYTYGGGGGGGAAGSTRVMAVK